MIKINHLINSDTSGQYFEFGHTPRQGNPQMEGAIGKVFLLFEPYEQVTVKQDKKGYASYPTNPMIIK